MSHRTEQGRVTRSEGRLSEKRRGESPQDTGSSQSRKKVAHSIDLPSGQLTGRYKDFNPSSLDALGANLVPLPASSSTSTEDNPFDKKTPFENKQHNMDFETANPAFFQMLLKHLEEVPLSNRKELATSLGKLIQGKNITDGEHILDMITAATIGYLTCDTNTNRTLVQSMVTTVPTLLKDIGTISASAETTISKLLDIPKTLEDSLATILNKLREHEPTLEEKADKDEATAGEIYNGLPRLSRIELINSYLAAINYDVKTIVLQPNIYQDVIHMISKKDTILNVTSSYKLNPVGNNRLKQRAKQLYASVLSVHKSIKPLNNRYIG